MLPCRISLFLDFKKNIITLNVLFRTLQFAFACFKQTDQPTVNVLAELSPGICKANQFALFLI